MLVFQILFGIVYVIAAMAAILGCLGGFNLMISMDDDPPWWAHLGVWLVSLAVASVLIAIAASNQWGPFDPNSCSRSRPCVRVVQTVAG